MSATAEHSFQAEAAPQPFPLIDPEKQLEWVNGHWVVKESGGARHSRICARLCASLGLYVEEHKLGAIYGPDTTFTFGQNQRMPDVSFVAATHLPPEGDPIGIWTIAPDLAVEIVSPNDLYEEVMTRLHEYFAASVQQVWLVSPQFQMVTVYDSSTKSTILQASDELTSPTLLPGFRCPVNALFQSLARQADEWRCVSDLDSNSVMNLGVHEWLSESCLYQEIAQAAKARGRLETLHQMLRRAAARRFPGLELGAEIERITDLTGLEDLCLTMHELPDVAALQARLAALLPKGE